MTQVKICGITNIRDALAAVEAGANALGFIFAPSPRELSPTQAHAIIRELPPFVVTVGVVVDQDPRMILARCPLDAIQFHGMESPEALCAAPTARRVKALRVRREADLTAMERYHEVAHAILLESYVPGLAGGTGQTFPWDLAVMAKERWTKPLILAGGLTPENVGRAVEQVRPTAVDVSSGVEAAPGRKDHALVRDFVAAVRAADRERLALA
jgi:phosphoribosylanthranilate isomerase